MCEANRIEGEKYAGILFLMSLVSDSLIGIGLDVGDGKRALGKGGDAGVGAELLEALVDG